MTKTTLETTQSLVGTGVSPYYMELKQHGMLQSMGSQRVGHDLATEQQKKQHVFTLGSPDAETGFRRNALTRKCSGATLPGSEQDWEGKKAEG